MSKKRVIIHECIICGILSNVETTVAAARYEAGACMESPEEEAEVVEEYAMDLVDDMLDRIEKDYPVEIYWEDEE